MTQRCGAHGVGATTVLQSPGGRHVRGPVPRRRLVPVSRLHLARESAAMEELLRHEVRRSPSRHGSGESLRCTGEYFLCLAAPPVR